MTFIHPGADLHHGPDIKHSIAAHFDNAVTALPESDLTRDTTQTLLVTVFTERFRTSKTMLLHISLRELGAKVWDDVQPNLMLIRRTRPVQAILSGIRLTQRQFLLQS